MICYNLAALLERTSARSRGGIVILLGCCGLLTAPLAHAAEASASALMSQAETAFRAGNRSQALKLATQAVELEPKNFRTYFLRARFYEDGRQHQQAIADFDQVLKLETNSATAFQHRGSEHFILGHIAESIADFDRFIALVPQQAPHHWQRGISLYYAGRYEEGRKQFESHQTVNPSDVENAVWHFLCVARAAGVEKARAAFIPIREDSRVPMMQLHALFAGKAKPEDVLAAARSGDASPARLREQLFYAHLYLGLYFEATGDDKLAREHIYKAADEYKSDHYMGDVARVHAERFRKNAKPTALAPSGK